MRTFALYVLTPVLSFIGGFYAYIWVLKAYWQQELGNGTASVLINGGLAYFALAIPLYFLIVGFIDKRAMRFKWLFYPLLCMLVFFLPTFVITMAWGDGNLVSAEALMFHSFFLTSGFIFGLLIWCFKLIFDSESNQTSA